MSLTTIRSPLAAELGLQISNQSSLEYLTNEINRSAKELFDMHDLQGCERELLLRLNQTAHTVSLPSFVHSIFAVRNYNSSFPIEITDQRPRYMQDGWDLCGTGYYSWRDLGNFPLNKKLTEAIHVKVKTPEANGSAFVVTITGSNNRSAKYIERLSFSATDTEKTTVGIFSDIKSITKAVQTTFDILCYDDDNNHIATINNDGTDTSYKHIQIANINEARYDNLVVEILFKHKFIPVVEGTDIFVWGDLYDEVIYYNTVARLLGKQQGQEDRVQMALGNATRILISITANIQSNWKKKIQFGENQYFKMFSCISQGGTL